ncbi:MAG: HD domain-containing protein [Weeksellaceae bacterium]|nr:HD domain-containing protein [Weeksellaceae bacterium]
MANKLKIFNDPVYGFISIPDSLIFHLIEHRIFQRLRRISQTGLSNYVYPGCNHTRFLHALGCLHLMQKAVRTLRQKGVEITAAEERAVYIAILLHDAGHGPFSHALESTLVEDVHHEEISLRLMHLLNEEFNGELSLAIEIFTNKYHKKFLSQLIAGQLDIDRLDYLKRDSFFSGVTEGNIGSDRIISMMNVADNQLVMDEKGIYSVEKYLISRMFMYWQVYLHKTSIAAEIYLIQTLRRAKELVQQGYHLDAHPGLQYFLNRVTGSSFDAHDLEIFVSLDDHDVISAVKLWQHHEDPTLAFLSRSLIRRKLPKAQIRNMAVTEEEYAEKVEFCRQHIGEGSADYLVHATPLTITPYDNKKQSILLLDNEGCCTPIEHSQKQILTASLLQSTTKFHFCYWNTNKLKAIMLNNN